MNIVISADGTHIAFDQHGSGPTLILVSGALQYRAFDQALTELAQLLAPHFTVIFYDRRGRGDSGDTLPYAVEREIEDIAALINAAGGPAFLFGISSGGALALEAALSLGDSVRKVAIYEAPYNAEPDARQAWVQYRQRLDTVLADGRSGDAVGVFMQLVGMPEDQVPMMRQDPSWPLFEAIGHTLAYDAAALGPEADIPLDRAARLEIPALIMAGDASFPFMDASAAALAQAVPQGQHRTLAGQSHEAEAAALAPVLREFFKG